jgi:hypothetical protein
VRVGRVRGDWDLEKGERVRSRGPARSDAPRSLVRFVVVIQGGNDKQLLIRMPPSV